MKIKRMPVLILLFVLACAGRAAAHCDTLDGPVVQDARAALESGKPEVVLKWVGPESEAEVRKLFADTVKVRKLSPEAKRIADLHFFETVVRLHRASEGEPYTGLKPAGQGEESVRHADEMLARGSADQLAAMASAEAAEVIKKKFTRVVETRKHANDSVAAGREYVAAYVDYVHFVESFHQLLHGPAHGQEGHGQEGHGQAAASH